MLTKIKHKMKIQLVANMSANGQLILLAQAGAYTAPPEVASMGFAKALIQ